MYEYFQSEMQHLHDSAQEFAEVYPKQASMLNLKSMQSKDPHIERLLEGTAYLTAHIQRRLDDDLSEFSDCMVHHLWPEILKPYPSALIAKFSPVRNQLVKTYVLPKGSKFVSPAVGPEKITCEFKTSASIKINPIHIIHIESIKNQSQEEVLKIHLKTDSNIEFS
ncbi:MAG: type VI secretion system baseplate subunit TssF, partial [Proteobacteria bacterium]|nr:type VI secretion system baseplate subunit TssF [Pseudomonadota bacterium]